MPLYEYHCDACGRRFELIRKFSDPPLEQCPTCGGRVRKLVSSPAFTFKGTGFYVTDYVKKDQAHDGAESGAVPAKESKEQGKEEKAVDKAVASDKTDGTAKPKTGEKATKSATPVGSATADATPAPKTTP
jgi:putative FmdB family regulatory protein